jgi:hypothetical protein
LTIAPQSRWDLTGYYGTNRRNLKPLGHFSRHDLSRLRVEPRTWDAFHLLAIEGRSGAEVARHLEMKVATVFVARSKVQRMLREEVMRLEQN